VHKSLTFPVTIIILLLLFYTTCCLVSVVNTIDAPTTPVSDCMSIESSGYYYLTKDLSGVEETRDYCISIYANNVVLDGNGYGIIGFGQGGGIYIDGSYNVTIKNVKISGYGIGISFLRVSSSTIMNSSIVNSNVGIEIGMSSFIIISNVRVNNGQNNGIYIYKSNSNIITNVEVLNYEDSGVKLIESNNNTIVNITITNNKGAGVVLHDSNNNVIVNSILSNNGIGIDFSGSSKNNTIVSNIVSTNTWGVSFRDYSSNNLIYNNYFKNTINVFFEISRPNTWNIAKIKGENIIGGGYLGGNYWSSLGERGFSDTCSDRDNDGICDDPFVIDENNVDQYPLKPIQQTSTTTLIQTPTLTPLPISIIIVIGAVLAVFIVIILIAMRKIRK